MENIIIIAVIAFVLGVGVVFSVKHFKGESSCCGGGDFKPKRKKLSHVEYKKTFKVNGMHCSACKNRVELAVNDIKGVACKADLGRGEIIVSYAQPVDDSVIIAKVEKAGYSVAN